MTRNGSQAMKNTKSENGAPNAIMAHPAHSKAPILTSYVTEYSTTEIYRHYAFEYCTTLTDDFIRSSIEQKEYNENER
uniref:Uncharacterized protein n=1 Tax=Romanomermis culicivorax TaxID=13658 RepID=A0A915JNC3_ROMCU